MSGWVCVPVATGCTIITQVCIIGRTVGMIMVWVDSIVPMFCGQAMVTEQWADRGGREGGSVSVGTFHSPVLLGNFPLTLLLSCHLTTLLPCHITTLQPYHLTTLLPDHPTTKRKSVSERKGQWVLPFSMFWQVTVCCSVLFTPSCYHIWLWHIILLYDILIIRPS